MNPLSKYQQTKIIVNNNNYSKQNCTNTSKLIFIQNFKRDRIALNVMPDNFER